MMTTVIKSKLDIEEIEMDLVGLCNLQCPLCTRNYAHAEHMLKKNVRPIEEIIAQLDTFKNLQRFFIAGAVSEPTMYKYFDEFIDYLNSRDIYYELFTNGNTRDTEWWAALAKRIPDKCKVYFTICGSTQELHAKYRVGSDLQQILDHAAAYRSTGKTNDYIQHILFEYNKEDLASQGMQDIVNSFNNVLYVDSEGIRRLTDYKHVFSTDIRPRHSRDNLIKELFRRRPKPDDGKKYEINCKSLQEKKVYINQFGKISACYIHAEFEQDYFEGEILDYTDILEFKYPDCFLCEKQTKCFIEKMGLDFVC
jgi:MoaA/NifB/PqqE/SkfB family radical SAM enzyme